MVKFATYSTPTLQALIMFTDARATARKPLPMGIRAMLSSLEGGGGTTIRFFFQLLTA
jgi:hypothetical protein